MTRLLVAIPLAAAFVLATPAAVLACPGKANKTETAFKKITIEDLAARQERGEQLTVVDANSKETRTKYGVIPGAVLLTSYAEFDMDELPAKQDSTLVFYCASEMCGAAPKAAIRAIESGYSQVYVLPAGIRGWTKAGQPVEQPNT